MRGRADAVSPLQSVSFARRCTRLQIESSLRGILRTFVPEFTLFR